MRRKVLLIIMLLMLRAAAASAELSWLDPPVQLGIGEPQRFTFLAEAGTAAVSLLNRQGETLSVVRRELATQEGYNSFFWDGSTGSGFLPRGLYTLRLSQGSWFADWRVLLRDEPPASPAGALDTHWLMPSDQSGAACDHAACYWTLPMGSTDEQAVWEALTAPITVLKGDQRKQKKVRQEPSESCKTYTGEVTYASQGVHVLGVSEDGKWTRIGAYSSSVEGSSVRVFADYFEGWVESSLLISKEVSQKYGVVIDKLKQRLYVYRDGKLFTTLLCSTGFAKRSTPFNETPAGEFLAISWSGGFWSSNLWCDYGIRINDGILLHEVPILVTTDSSGSEIRDQERCENYLGDRASHGCIRIQRQPSPEGVNMKWLWDNLERSNTRVFVWDDRGRQLSSPDPELQLYYNPDSGRMYHSSATCQAVHSRFWPLTAFSYSQLTQKPFSKLKFCPACAPEPAPAVVEKLNTDARK